MAEGKGFKGCIVAVVWLVILAIVAVTVRYFWTEPQKEKLQSDTGSNSSYSHEVKIQADLFSGYSVLRSEERRRPGLAARRNAGAAAAAAAASPAPSSSVPSSAASSGR